MDLKRVNKLGYFILIILAVSCDSKKKYDSYQSLTNATWELNTPVAFEVLIDDVSLPQNIFLNIRTDSEYPYRNIFVIGKVTFPNGAILKDTMEYEMADAFGNWLGDGITDVKDNKLFYLENFNFPKKGTYKFEFFQAMRKRNQITGLQQLKGVTDVGLRIEKTQN